MIWTQERVIKIMGSLLPSVIYKFETRQIQIEYDMSSDLNKVKGILYKEKKIE